MNSDNSVISKLVKSYLAPKIAMYDTDKNDSLCDVVRLTPAALFVIEIAILVSLSHFFHLILKRFKLPTAASQMLVGILMGPTVFGHFNITSKESSTRLDGAAFISRIFFMFLVGIETDTSYLKRTMKSTITIFGTNIIACSFISLMVGPILFYFIAKSNTNIMIFTLSLLLILFNTASPPLIRLLTELKLTMTELGKVAVSAALVNDITCLVPLSILAIFGDHNTSQYSNSSTIIFMTLLMIFSGIAMVMLRAVVKKVNKLNESRHEIGNDVTGSFLMFTLLISMYARQYSFDPMIPAFIVGSIIPKNGPTSRTIANKLTKIVHVLIMPVFFGNAGMHTDLGMLRHKEVVITVLVVLVFGMIGIVGGTMVASKKLGMQVHEGLVLGLLLNVKGHVDLMAISIGKDLGIWDENVYMGLLITILLNTLIACPAASYAVHRERESGTYMSRTLEHLDLNKDLRILSCVHSKHDVPTMLDLIEISSAELNKSTQYIPYIYNLIELKNNVNSSMFYQQLQNNDFKNSDFKNSDTGSQAQVSVLVDRFIKETGIAVLQLTAISCIETMHLDTRYAVQDVQASLIIVPFHRKIKFDGRMGASKEGVRQFNMNVLKDVSCSVGILVDRGIMRKQEQINPSFKIGDNKMCVQVLVLFLGGKDDREAASYAGRLAYHPFVSVTMIRFAPETNTGSRVHVRERQEGSNSMGFDVEGSGDPDEIFLTNFYNRYVVNGMINYEDVLVKSSAELVSALSSVANTGVYSLYIVGRERQGKAAQLTKGMSEWEECPELGSIGDMLASSDVKNNGSVLVIQQHDESQCTLADML